jgi:hypothetical protein
MMAQLSKKKTLRDMETVCVISTGLLALYFIFKVNILLFVAFGLLLAGLLSHLFARLITKLWYKLAEMLGYISSRILMTVVYYLVLFPLAMLYRLFNKDPLSLKKRPGQSLFNEREHVYTAKDFEHPW